METGLIQINKKKLPLMDTVISAVNCTYPKADEKEIEFVFDYAKELETCTIMQDKRWLSCVLSSNLKKETLVERIRYQG